MKKTFRIINAVSGISSTYGIVSSIFTNKNTITMAEFFRENLNAIFIIFGILLFAGNCIYALIRKLKTIEEKLQGIDERFERLGQGMSDLSATTYSRFSEIWKEQGKIK